MKTLQNSSRLNSPHSLSLPSQGTCFSPVIMFMASFGFVLIGLLLSCIQSQSWMQHSRRDLTRAEQRCRIGSLILLANAALSAAQDVFVFLGCKYTFLGHVELLVQQRPQVLLRSIHNPFSTQPLFVLGTALTQVQDLSLYIIERPEACMCKPHMYIHLRVICTFAKGHVLLLEQRQNILL